MTLVELVTALAVMTLVVGSLYLLLGAGIRGRLIVHARVSDQERGRQATAWLADHLRQISYDPAARCPEGLLLAGTGEGFAERLAFRAVVDARLDPPRRIYVFYTDRRTLWQEMRLDDEGDCFAEHARSAPAADRVAVTPPTVEGFSLAYHDAAGRPAVRSERVRSVGITVRLEAPSTPGRVEAQTYHTLVTLRGP